MDLPQAITYNLIRAALHLGAIEVIAITAAALAFAGFYGLKLLFRALLGTLRMAKMRILSRKAVTDIGEFIIALCFARLLSQFDDLSRDYTDVLNFASRQMFLHHVQAWIVANSLVALILPFVLVAILAVMALLNAMESLSLYRRIRATYHRPGRPRKVVPASAQAVASTCIGAATYVGDRFKEIRP
jgi:hypothetical protein